MGKNQYCLEQPLGIEEVTGMLKYSFTLNTEI